jgi:uncharacterized HAD superfamily protein
MIIGVDMDSVIADILPTIDAFHNKKYGTTLIPDDHSSYDLSGYWNCTAEEVYRRIFEYYESDEFHSTPPVAGAQRALTQLSVHHELHLITARPYDIEQKTHDWLNTYFPAIFTHIHHTNLISKGGKGKSIKKSDVCKALGATLMIDDHIEYALDCAENGIETILFPAPWNAGKSVSHPKVKKVNNWDEIVNMLPF